MRHLTLVLAVLLGFVFGCDDGAGDGEGYPDPEYIDLDGDGYCPDGVDLDEDGDCSEPDEQAVPHGYGDCDDTDNLIHPAPPSVQEVCDGADNDCNGRTDEDLFQGCQCYCPIPYNVRLECIDGEWEVCDCDVLCDSI